MKRISVLFFVSLLYSTVTCAAVSGDIKPTLLLDHLKVTQAQERDGDELYFDIDIYQPNHIHEYLRVPAKPMSWSAKSMDRFSQIALWNAPLKNGEKVVLLVSLMDNDGSLLNPDDLLGLVRLDLANDGGVLKAHWSMPNRPVEKIMPNPFDVQKFHLDSGDTRYELSLVLKK